MPEIASKSALRVRQLRKAYKDVVAVDGLDLEVQAGECFGLLGPNGAGKTTTVEICEGLTPPDSGEVEVLGRRWSSDAAQLRQRLGIQLQDTQLSEKLTVLRNGPPVSQLFPARGRSLRGDRARAARRKTKFARGRSFRRPETAAGSGLRAGRRSRFSFSR